MQRPVRVLVCVLAAAVAAAPLAAAVYTIQLTNGYSFETRYEPEDASYDSGKVVFLDEAGLLITIAKSDIVSIQSDFEAKGYGPDAPLINKKTKAARAKNRRVEFKLISSLDAAPAAEEPAPPAE